MRWPAPPDRTVDRINWHRWWAWYPVRIDGDSVWLEVVERKGTFHYDSCGGTYSYEYRNAQTVSGDA